MTWSSEASVVDPDALADDRTEDYVTMSVGGQLFGVPVLTVQYVLKTPGITPIPLAPPEVGGGLNLRGRVVTAIDMRVRLNLPPREPEQSGMCVVVEHEGELYSLLVDEVGDVLSLPQKDFERNPVTIDTLWREVSAGLYRLEDSLLIVLDVHRVLGAAAVQTT